MFPLEKQIFLVSFMSHTPGCVEKSNIIKSYSQYDSNFKINQRNNSKGFFQASCACWKKSKKVM